MPEKLQPNMRENTVHGLIIGKFMPPHLGHVHLFDFGAGWCDALTIVVEHIAGEPIPSATRAAWVAELAPRARVLHLDRAMPQRPEDHPDFWEIWRAALLGLLPDPPAVVFASEAYGAPLAACLGARFIPVDLPRAAVPISATAIRADPQACWPMLPPPVRAHYARRIAVLGPESSGKTTLSRYLAAELGATFVPEHARALLEQPGSLDRGWPAVLDDVARGQRASEAALARATGGLLVCDTDLLTTALWSEALTGACAPWITEAAAEARYTLSLVCAPDLPFEPDPVRYQPEARPRFFAELLLRLRALGRPHVVIEGEGPARSAAALRAVRAALAAPLRAHPA
jgi:NadR type nicotinamide-nucleotide adenylyltransferase